MIVIYSIRGAGFRTEDWLRFWVLVWVGTVFVLVGMSLKYRLRTAALAAGLVGISGPIAVLVYDQWLK
jgi:hypothetical protein